MTAISPFIAVNTRNSVSALLRYVNCTPAVVGSTFGTVDNVSGYADSASVSPYSSVRRFGGSSSFLAVTGNQIYRSVDGGAATWTSVYTLTPLASTYQGSKIGLFVVNVNSVATAVVIWFDNSSGDFYAATSVNGTSWTTYGPFMPPASDIGNYMSDVEIWRGNIYAVMASGSVAHYYSLAFFPAIGSMTFTTFAAPVGQFTPNGSLTVMDDRLLMCLHDSSSGGGFARLWELVGGAWVQDAVIATTGPSINSNHYRTMLFNDGNYLYAFFLANPNSGAGGWKCYQIALSGYAMTDITSSIIPTALQGTVSVNGKFKAIVDNRQTPATPLYFLMYASDNTAVVNWNQYLWANNTTTLALLDTGGRPTDGIPELEHSQGSIFWTAGENYIELKGETGVLGGIQYSYALYSDSGTTSGLNLRGWHAPQTAPLPVSPATLSGITTGLVADGTTKTIMWLASTDGYSPGDIPWFSFEQY